MADDEHAHDEHEEPDDADGDRLDGSGSDPTPDDEDDDETPGTDADHSAGMAASPGWSEDRRQFNAATVGHLTLHYRERDVHIPLDGHSALRLLAMYRGRARGPGDPLDEDSSAFNGWLVLDLAEPLAMSWLPQLPRPRTAIDPHPEADAA